MATYTWTHDVSGDWNTGTLWTPGTVPNDVTADVTIDAATTLVNGYTVTIAAGESFTVNSLTLNDLNQGANSPNYNAAALELDGTLVFAPGSAGSLGAGDSSLQSYIYTPAGTNAEIVNAGTINGFVQSSGNLLITGTNGVYITNYLQALAGTVVIDTKSIAEMTGNTLFDGIFEAKTANLPPALIELGGSLEGHMVSIGTIEGPTIAGGWTELTFNGVNTAIDEWNGTTYVAVESTLTDIKGGGTVDVLGGRDYNTTNTITIEAHGTNALAGLLNLQAGTVTTGGLNINGGIVQGFGTIAGGVVNTGTLDALAGTLNGIADVRLDLTGGLTGTGTVLFDMIENQGAPTVNPTGATLEVNSVSSGQTFDMNGNDTLQIDALANFAGTVAAKGGDKLVLQGVTATSAHLTGGSLVLMNGTSTAGTIALTGTFGANAFSTTAVAGGTQVNLGSASGVPSVSAGGIANYAAGGAAVALDAALSLADPGSSILTSATVAIGSGFIAGDTLAATAQPGITTHYNAATGMLTLSGSASLAAYQTELDSATFSFSPGDPTSGYSDNSRIINFSINDGSNSATANSSVAVTFNSNPKLDLLFQNTDGSLALWQTNGDHINAYGNALPNPGPTWSLAATGGFYAGDTADYAYQRTDGSVAVWQVNGEHLTSGTIIANPGIPWQIKGTADFYGDSKSDILLQNQDGSVALWEMTGAAIGPAGFATYNGALANPGPAWQIKGTADFNADHKSDIVLQNQDGSLAVWEMSGTVVSHAGVVTLSDGTTVANPGPSWRVVGTGDFSGNGHSDILLQNDNGPLALWEVNGSTITTASMIQYNGSDANPGPTQHAVGTGDFNNDGKTDIVFRSDTGAVSTWVMNGSTISSAAALANPGASWNSVGNGAMQFMYSGAAGETLTSPTQVPDEFVFTSVAAGAHTIAGFNGSQDVIELSAARFGGFAGVQQATTASGGGAMINLGNGSSLLLSGVDPSKLHASNFALT